MVSIKECTSIYTRLQLQLALEWMGYRLPYQTFLQTAAKMGIIKYGQLSHVEHILSFSFELHFVKERLTFFLPISSAAAIRP